MTLKKFTVTTARGMLPVLQQELTHLGIEKIKPTSGSIGFIGSLTQAYQVCLWSRVAIRVLMPIAHFAAKDTDALYEGVKMIPWENHILDENSTIAVDFHHFRSKIKHSQFGAQRVKDAIVDRFIEQIGQRPSVELREPDVRINVYLAHNQAKISIDLSGDSLHKRGYRLSPTTAPLKEHIAALMLYQAKWPQLARRGSGFLDPMCGSATFVIEAALMAADIAPGLSRDYFGFLYWKQHDKQAWQTIKADAIRRRQAGLSRLPTIRGCDKDASAIKAAADNIAEIGLSEYIELEQIDFTSNPVSHLPERGVILTNPPYGQRIGSQQDLPQLYYQLGELVQTSLPSWQLGLITDNEALLKQIKLSVQQQYAIDNGPIPCQVIHYAAKRGERWQTRAKDITTLQAATPQQDNIKPLSAAGEMFANRLKKNEKHLQRWANKHNIRCYRLYDADLPDYAVAIDRYDNFIHVQEYAPPKKIDPQKAVERLTEVLDHLPQLLAVPEKNIVVKMRQKQKGKQQYNAQSQLKQRFVVEEGGGQFWINLSDYLDTGLFLDHRITRQMVADCSAGKKVLNLFAYTGSVTVYAAIGGAASTTTVDLSNTYLQWAQDNMALNGFEEDHHHFIRADCLQWLQQDNEQYDLIFLDPPTFSNSSRMDKVLDIQRDHSWLIQQAMKRLAPEGKLFFSTNKRHFKLAPIIAEQFTLKDISKITLPIDFKRQNKSHFCWVIRH